jgi:L-amino acid N-acyltransferase YncA
MDIVYEKCSFLKFAFGFGLKYVRHETIRILARTILERKRNKIVVAKTKSGGIVGYCVARPCPRKYNFAHRDEWMIGPYFVLEQHRGTGIGTELLKQTEGFCSSKMFCSYVLIQNIGSCKSFEKAGYKNIGYMKQDGRGYYSLCDSGKFYVFRKVLGAYYEKSNNSRCI